MIVSEYYVNVARIMGILPRPRQRGKLELDRAEQLARLPIIKVSGMDSDYYERSEFNGLHPMVQ